MNIPPESKKKTLNGAPIINGKPPNICATDVFFLPFFVCEILLFHHARVQLSLDFLTFE